uniref:ATP synthase complex subunit 8 n=1 Tax=Chrysomeloidea sp. 3 KM-2017 TaxID=2219297 RepID=A0A346RK33_9CUCU|nr:ATP synthase F0 subunit 8 [Chrysomeloidea sp. 3 KM-2017]
MPQMAPLSWLLLFSFFLLLFYLFLTQNFFVFSYLPKYQKSSKKNIILNWKW